MSLCALRDNDEHFLRLNHWQFVVILLYVLSFCTFKSDRETLAGLILD